MGTGSSTAVIKIKAKDETAKAFNSAQTGLKKVGDFAGSVQTQIAGLVGAAGFGALIQVNLDAAASTKKMSDALGMNVEDLSAWQYAVRGTKVDAEKMGDIFKDVSEKIGDAYANGAGEALEVMERLNLDTAQMVAMAPDQQLLAIAGALDQVGTHAEKVQIMESLGSDLSLLLPLLDDNAAGFRNMRDEAEDLNAIITNESAAAAEQYKDDLEKLKASTSGLAMELGTKALPALTNITGAMVQAAKDAGVLEALWVGLGGAAVELFELEGSMAWQAENDAEARDKQAKKLRDLNAALLSNRNTMDQSALAAAGLSARLIFLREDGMSETSPAVVAITAALDAEKQKLQESSAAVQQLTIDHKNLVAAQQAKAAPAEIAKINPPAASSDKEQKQQEELEKLRTKQQDKYAVMIEGFAGEMELTYIHEAEKQEFLNEALANEAITKQQHQMGLTLIEQEGATARQRIAETERKNKLSVYSGMMGNLTALMASGSKDQFEIGKVASLATATIKGYEAITSSYAAGAKVGGPWVGAAYAATAAIATAAQIGQLSSQQFSGGGSISYSGGVSAGGDQAIVTPLPPALSETEQQASTGTTTINLIGNSGDKFTYEQVDEMFDAFAEALDSGDKVLIARDSLQAQELSA